MKIEMSHAEMKSAMSRLPTYVILACYYDGESLSYPDELDAEILAARSAGPDLKAYAAAKRWDVENGGISVGGVPIATDDRSKTMIMGARIKADADAGYTVRWKTADGFVTLAASDIVNISDAVLNHIDASFNAEADVFGLIDAGEISTIKEIDEYDWPS